MFHLRIPKKVFYNVIIMLNFSQPIVVEAVIINNNNNNKFCII